MNCKACKYTNFITCYSHYNKFLRSLQILSQVLILIVNMRTNFNTQC